MTLNLRAVPLLKATKVPQFVELNTPSGYMYNYVPGTDLSNGKIKISVTGAAGAAHAELTAGVVPAGVASDVVNAYVIFPGGQR
jgi:hypothetical protein